MMTRLVVAPIILSGLLLAACQRESLSTAQQTAPTGRANEVSLTTSVNGIVATGRADCRSSADWTNLYRSIVQSAKDRLAAQCAANPSSCRVRVSLTRSCLTASVHLAANAHIGSCRASASTNASFSPQPTSPASSQSNGVSTSASGLQQPNTNGGSLPTSSGGGKTSDPSADPGSADFELQGAAAPPASDSGSCSASAPSPLTGANGGAPTCPTASMPSGAAAPSDQVISGASQSGNTNTMALTAQATIGVTWARESRDYREYPGIEDYWRISGAEQAAWAAFALAASECAIRTTQGDTRTALLRSIDNARTDVCNAATNPQAAASRGAAVLGAGAASSSIVQSLAQACSRQPSAPASSPQQQ
jgi:hypothetical protein